MTSAAAVREHRRVEELCAATVRALTGDPALRLRAHRLHRGGHPVPADAPHLHPSPDDDLGSFRGAADGLALRMIHSDHRLHRSLMPPTEVGRLVFELLEQFRVESLAPAHLPGMVRNLRHRHETWSHAFQASGLTETFQGLVLYTVAQVCRARVTAEPVVARTEDLLEETRFQLAPLIGPELAVLRRSRADQAVYARHARALADKIAALVDEADPAASGARPGWTQRNGFTLWAPSEGGQDGEADGGTGAGSRPTSPARSYRVFTTAYDREDDVTRVVRHEQLVEHRGRLDEWVAASRISVPRLARTLADLFTVPVDDGWLQGQEEGRVDGRRLSQLVVSPAERRLFQVPDEQPAPAAAITFLLDCSGSMRRHLRSTAVLVDVFARAADLAGVGCEVLGFTTRAWNGGRAFRDWRRAGRPAQPGRLNEVHHLVLQAAGTPWRRSRLAIAGLLREDLYREGVTGEALSWAGGRLRRRPEQTRVLVVVTDGGAVDSATALANGDHYLDRHLLHVLGREERDGAQLLGLGLGSDPGPYQATLVLDPEQPLDAGVRELVAALAGLLHRRAH